MSTTPGPSRSRARRPGGPTTPTIWSTCSGPNGDPARTHRTHPAQCPRSRPVDRFATTAADAASAGPGAGRCVAGRDVAGGVGSAGRRPAGGARTGAARPAAVSGRSGAGLATGVPRGELAGPLDPVRLGRARIRVGAVGPFAVPRLPVHRWAVRAVEVA